MIDSEESARRFRARSIARTNVCIVLVFNSSFIIHITIEWSYDYAIIEQDGSQERRETNDNVKPSIAQFLYNINTHFDRDAYAHTPSPLPPTT